MLEMQVFKPLDRTTASLELWDGGAPVAEVFAVEGGRRRLYLCEAGQQHGLDWTALAELAPRITALLDEADEEMRLARRLLGEP
jgi:hypothetical protein